mgnify:CR=1 FL=1
MEARNEKQKAEIDKKQAVKQPMPAGLPYLASGAVFFVFAMLLPMYRLTALLIAIAVLVVLERARAKQVAAMPVVTPVRQRTEEISKLLDAGRDQLHTLQSQIRSDKVGQHVESMAGTLQKLADNLEQNPKDRGKIRKVAVHYVPMITDLVKNYINLEQQGIDGSNISATMASIESGLEKIDESLKQYLDDMFEDDKMSIETDITVLRQLMNKDAEGVNKMNFDDILKETNGGNENV